MEIKYLISKLEECFEGSPWYGDSVIEKLNSIDYRIVNTNTATFTNSIAKIIQHIINWKILVIKKIQGEAYNIELNDSIDWEDIEINSKLEWENLIDKLLQTQKELKVILMNQSDSILEDRVPGRNYNFRFLIEGVIQHDIYHLGQIGLMAKLKIKS